MLTPFLRSGSVFFWEWEWPNGSSSLQWFSCKETLAKFEDRASQSKSRFIGETEWRYHFEVYSIGSNSSKNHIIDSVEADILFPQSIYASYSFDYHINVNGDVVCTNLYVCITKKDYHVLTVDFERLEGTIWKKRFRGLEKHFKFVISIIVNHWMELLLH